MLYIPKKLMVYPTAILLGIIHLGGCSTVSAGKIHPNSEAKRGITHRPLSDQDRLRITSIAQEALGKPNLLVGKKHFRSDCSGTVRAIFAKANLSLGGIVKWNWENDVKAIYRYVKKYGAIKKTQPFPGDLVFFHNTYDRSRNGRMKDALTHVGIVEKIEGTVVHFIHHLGQSIIRSRLDLTRPKDTVDVTSNKRINDVLRRAQGPNRAYTAGELFAGFGRL
jgi:hypothetical protein